MDVRRAGISLRVHYDLQGPSRPFLIESLRGFWVKLLKLLRVFDESRARVGLAIEVALNLFLVRNLNDVDLRPVIKQRRVRVYSPAFDAFFSFIDERRP